MVLGLALLGPLFAPDPLAQPDLVAGTLQPPSLQHWLGTDQFSRDVFARLAHGARWSLVIALVAVSIATAVGMAVGTAAGHARGWVGETLGRTIDLSLAIPRVVVLLVLLATLGSITPPWLGVVLGLTGWPAVARLARGEAMRLRDALHVSAARALGASPFRVVSRSIVPGVLPTVSVAATLGVADAMLLEAGLSFLGLGVRPPAPTWGGMILEAREHLASAPWLLLAPSVALVCATAAATLFGDALRQRHHSGNQ
jgi:peptide/nickel transport system permease protein